MICVETMQSSTVTEEINLSSNIGCGLYSSILTESIESKSDVTNALHICHLLLRRTLCDSSILFFRQVS